MTMMNHDFRPDRERKPLEDLIRQALSAYGDQGAGDDDKAETVRAFTIENDLADYRDLTDAAFGQILLRTNLLWLIADMAARVNTLIEFVGAECFDQIDDRTTSKGDKLAVLVGEAHSAVTRFFPNRTRWTSSSTCSRHSKRTVPRPPSENSRT